MQRNPVVDLLLSRKSIRRFTDEDPSDEIVEAIVRCGQQAPFAAQLASFILSKDREKNPFGAPLLFTILVDIHRLERMMARRGWTRISSDGAVLIFGIQDAAYAAENMVIAAESFGMGSCFLGAAPFRAEGIVQEARLPEHVFPLVQLAIGYPAEDPPPRPRFPLDFSLFEDRYPALDDDTVDVAMAKMDDGYLAQDYYRSAGYMIPLEAGREESFSFDDYSWTEHMGRKWGQWLRDPNNVLGSLGACGFDLEADRSKGSD